MRHREEQKPEKPIKFDPQAAKDLETRKNPTKHAFSRKDEKEGKNECHYCGAVRIEHKEEVDCSSGQRLVRKVK